MAQLGLILSLLLKLSSLSGYMLKPGTICCDGHSQFCMSLLHSCQQGVICGLCHVSLYTMQYFRQLVQHEMLTSGLARVA